MKSQDSVSSFIDSHTHIEFEEFDNDRDDVLKRAKNAGVETIFAIGTDLQSIEKCIAISKSEIIKIFVAGGFHPSSLESATENEWKMFEALVAKNSFCAIGETGLDYYRNYSPRQLQREFFIRHIKIAKKYSLPLIIHCREAHPDVIKILKNEYEKGIRGIMHCFSGNEQQANTYIEMGFYISFAGPLTFQNAKNQQAVFKSIPIERLLFETDCPYLAPQNFRGKRNEPAYVVEIYDKASQLKEIPPETLKIQVQKNLSELFQKT